MSVHDSTNQPKRLQWKQSDRNIKNYSKNIDRKETRKRHSFMKSSTQLLIEDILAEARLSRDQLIHKRSQVHQNKWFEAILEALLINSMKKRFDQVLLPKRLMSQKNIDKLLKQERKQQLKNTVGSVRKAHCMKLLMRVSMFTSL